MVAGFGGSRAFYIIRRGVKGLVSVTFNDLSYSRYVRDVSYMLTCINDMYHFCLMNYTLCTFIYFIPYILDPTCVTYSIN